MKTLTAINKERFYAYTCILWLYVKVADDLRVVIQLFMHKTSLLLTFIKDVINFTHYQYH